MVGLRRSYIDGPYGQVHTLQAPAPASDSPLLVFLHATAYSAESLRPLLQDFVGERGVAALDTPGYGGSDGPVSPIAIEDYADALADSIRRLSHGRPVDVFGYHTGVTIAVEAALRHPGIIRRIAMVGVPLFDDDRAAWERRLGQRHELKGSLSQFEERWSYLVEERPAGLSLERAFGNFIDELRVWPNGWWAHAAVFAHNLASRLPLLSQPVLIINPDSALAELSRKAAKLIPNATLIERPDMSGAIFERYPMEVAALVRDFLHRKSVNKIAPHGERPGTEIAQARFARPDYAQPASVHDDIGGGEEVRVGANDGRKGDPDPGIRRLR